MDSRVHLSKAMSPVPRYEEAEIMKEIPNRLKPAQDLIFLMLCLTWLSIPLTQVCYIGRLY